MGKEKKFFTDGFHGVKPNGIPKQPKNYKGTGENPRKSNEKKLKKGKNY